MGTSHTQSLSISLVLSATLYTMHPNIIREADRAEKKKKNQKLRDLQRRDSLLERKKKREQAEADAVAAREEANKYEDAVRQRHQAYAARQQRVIPPAFLEHRQHEQHQQQQTPMSPTAATCDTDGGGDSAHANSNSDPVLSEFKARKLAAAAFKARMRGQAPPPPPPSSQGGGGGGDCDDYGNGDEVVDLEGTLKMHALRAKARAPAPAPPSGASSRFRLTSLLLSLFLSTYIDIDISICIYIHQCFFSYVVSLTHHITI